MMIILFLLALTIPVKADTTCNPAKQNCSSDASYRYGALPREQGVVRNSVFTKELADQCATVEKYDCQLVKTLPRKDPRR